MKAILGFLTGCLLMLSTLIGLMHSPQPQIDTQQIKQDHLLTALILDYIVEMQKKGILPKGGEK